MQVITPFLWFDGQAEEAADFYVSVFPGGRILDRMRSPEGAVLTVTFRILGQTITGLNGGPRYKLTPAVSFLVPCETQAEVDTYWDKLVEGGTPQQCGWLTDRFGLSWQICPTLMLTYMHDPDRAKADRAFQAMLGMVKFDIAALRRAYDGG